MRRDPLIDLLRRRTWAGWIDVLALFLISVILSVISGNAHVENWTTNENGLVTQHRGASLNLTGGPFFLWLAIAVLYYSIPEVYSGRRSAKGSWG